jgi:DNA-directed RNA polymerase II subunit RPB2
VSVLTSCFFVIWAHVSGILAPEQECIISHGASQFLLERLFEQSDAYSTVVCTACGFLAIPAKPKNAPVVGMAVRGYDEAHCRVCDTGAHVREVKMPYACKLLVQELMACCVAFRFRFDAPTSTAKAANGEEGDSHGALRPTRDAAQPPIGDERHGRHQEHAEEYDTQVSGPLPSPRLEGSGPGGSVLAALPSPTIDGILGRIETLLKTATAAGAGKRKRDDEDDLDE